MGNVKSFCCKDTASEVDDREERSRILSETCEGQNGSWDDLYSSSASGVSHQDTPSYGSINTSNANKIEQSALNKIIQKMASNVIDVAPGEPLVLQPIEVNERQKAYQTKINQIKVQLTLKSSRVQRWSFNNSSFDNLSNVANTTTGGTTIVQSPNSTFNQSHSPQHLPTTNKSLDSRRVDYEPLPKDEIQLVNQICQKSAQAVHDGLTIKSKDQVVVPMSSMI